MFISVRRYQGAKDVAELARRAEDFAAILKDLPGFKGYYALDAGDGIVASVTIFDSKEMALQSNEKAVAEVKKTMAVLLPEPPEITAGEAMVAISGS
ncbi:MAG: hypothetical protein ACE5MM_06475 [Nitrospiraceae bacterium]